VLWPLGLEAGFEPVDDSGDCGPVLALPRGDQISEHLRLDGQEGLGIGWEHLGGA
jgi:hypothetical protein